jgi:hypothetical protein
VFEGVFMLSPVLKDSAGIGEIVGNDGETATWGWHNPSRGDLTRSCC